MIRNAKKYHDITRCWHFFLVLLFLGSTVVLAQEQQQQQQQQQQQPPAEEHVELSPMAVVTCGTTKGDVEMTFYREWSPHGFDRVVKMFQDGFYDNSHFFRVVSNFLCQFGISYTTNEELKTFSKTPILDDTVEPNRRIPFEIGTISFAGSGPNSRTSHLFVSFMDKDAPNNQFGVNPWETPVGKITNGIEIAQQWYSGYGDMPPWGQGPEQQPIYKGPEYIETNFPQLDKFLTCQVETKLVATDSIFPKSSVTESDKLEGEGEGDSSDSSDDSDNSSDDADSTSSDDDSSSSSDDQGEL